MLRAPCEGFRSPRSCPAVPLGLELIPLPGCTQRCPECSSRGGRAPISATSSVPSASTMAEGFVSLRRPQRSSGPRPAEALSASVPITPSRPPLLLPTGVRRPHALLLRVLGRTAGGMVSSYSLEYVLPHLSSQLDRGSLLFTVSSSLSLLAPATQGSHVVVSDAGQRTHRSGQRN